jgi:hypothetical protein
MSLRLTSLHASSFTSNFGILVRLSPDGFTPQAKPTSTSSCTLVDMQRMN